MDKEEMTVKQTRGTVGERQMAFVNALKAVDSMKDEYLVYDHFITPVELHYYGYSGKDIDYRIQCGYHKTALEPYINECGWDNINTTIVADGLTRKEAELLEDQLIREGWKRGDCINKQGSGGEWRDNHKEYEKTKSHQCYMNKQDYYKELHKKYYDEHKEELRGKHKEYYNKTKDIKSKYSKQRNSTPEGKIYYRVSSFNRDHPDRKIETALEAKQKYLETGYIPDYVKNDDIECNYEAYYISALRDIAETVLDMRFDENNEVIVEPNEEYDEER